MTHSLFPLFLSLPLYLPRSPFPSHPFTSASLPPWGRRSVASHPPTVTIFPQVSGGANRPSPAWFIGRTVKRLPASASLLLVAVRHFSVLFLPRSWIFKCIFFLPIILVQRPADIFTVVAWDGYYCILTLEEDVNLLHLPPFSLRETVLHLLLSSIAKCD